MTCIIGVEHEGVVYMGADSIALNGWSKDVTAQSKLFQVGADLLFACAGNPRMAQIMRYLTDLPRAVPEGDNDERRLLIHVVEPIRKALKEYGYLTTENGQELGASFLIGFNGGVWEVNNSFQLCRSARKMCAMGVGDDHALGALYATLSQFETWTPTAIIEAIRHALSTAEALNSGVSRPFVLETLAARQPTPAADGLTINQEAFFRP